MDKISKHMELRSVDGYRTWLAAQDDGGNDAQRHNGSHQDNLKR